MYSIMSAKIHLYNTWRVAINGSPVLELLFRKIFTVFLLAQNSYKNVKNSCHVNAHKAHAVQYRHLKI